jgi:hypothetical protein
MYWHCPRLRDTAVNMAIIFTCGTYTLEWEVTGSKDRELCKEGNFIWWY